MKKPEKKNVNGKKKQCLYFRCKKRLQEGDYDYCAKHRSITSIANAFSRDGYGRRFLRIPGRRSGGWRTYVGK